MTNEVLVTPATVQEQLLGKISELRQRNLTARQKSEIENIEKNLVSLLKKFSYSYFGINKEQIQELSDQEIEALFLIVSKRARKTAIIMRMLGFSGPILGCSILAGGLLGFTGLIVLAYWKFLFFCGSISTALGFGILANVLSESKTIALSDSVRELKQILGDGFNPTQIIRSRINQ